MKTEKDSGTKQRKKLRTRFLQIILIFIVFLLVFVLFLVPAFISTEKGRQFILARINNSVDGRTDFSDLSVGWLKGIKVSDFSFDDNAGQISVQVKRIATEPHYGSLLAGNLSFGQTTIDEPRVQINLKNRPSAETIPGTESKSVPKETAGIALVTDIVVNDGNVKITDRADRTVEVSQINSRVNLRPPGEQTNFALNMAVASLDGQSQINTEGSITPAKTKSGWSLEGASGDFTVEVNDLDIESLEPFFALAGVDIKAQGNISVDLQSRFVDGQIDNVAGTIKGSQLEIETGLTQEKIQTSALDVDLKLTRSGQMINIDNVQVKTDWAQIEAGGTMPTDLNSLESFLGSDTDYNLKGAFDLDLAAVASQIPITLGLKEGMEISSGTITGDINTVGSAGQKQLQVLAELADLSGTVKGKQIALSAPVRAEAQISPDQTGVNINNMVVSAPFAQINAAGNLEQVTFKGQADLARLQSELGQFVDIGPYKITGQFIEAGQVSLSDKIVALSGSSTIEGLNITGPNDVTASMPTGEATYTLNLDRENNILNITSLDGDMSFGQFNIEDAVVSLKKDSGMSLNATILASELDLGEILPYAVLFAGLPKEMQLAGIAESETNVTYANDNFHIVTDQTSIEDFEFAYLSDKSFKQPNTSVVADIEFNPIDKTYSGKLNLLSDQIKLNFNLSNKKKDDAKFELQGNAELEYDWSVLSSIAGPYMPEGLELKGRRTDNISFASEYPINEPDKLLANLTANATLGFERADYMGLNVGLTDIDIEVVNGLLKVAPFATTVNEGRLNFACQADFKQQPPLFETAEPMQILQDIQIDDRTTQVLLKYLSPIFANAASVSGVANLSCQKLTIPLNSSAKNRAEIDGTVSIRQLRLQSSDLLGQILSVVGGGARGTVITIHPTSFVLRDGFLRYNDMQMDVGDNPVNFSGVIGLDKRLDMTVTLPYTTQGTTARIDRDTRGQRITLPLKGTVDKPEIDMGKLLENQGKQLLEDALRKGLEEIFR